MSTQIPYVLLSLIIILIVVVLVFFVGKNKNENRLTPLAGLAFGFIVAGILFGEKWVLGYGFLFIGVVIAIVDIFVRARKK
jgi:uncharacterized membrane protein